MSHQGLDNAALVCVWQIRPDSLKYLEVCVSVWRSKPCVSVSSRLARERGAACIRCDLQCMLCVKRKTTAPDREPSGTWLVCVCASRLHVLICCLCVCVCVFTWRGQAALNHCHSQRRRETLMFSHSDTYRTPLSWTLTVLRADACVLRRRAVTSHQTAAPRPLARSPVSPSAIIFPFPFVSRLSDVTLILLWNRHRFNSKGVAYTYDRCVFTCWKMEMCGKPSAPKQTRAGTSAFGVGIDKPPLKKMGFEAKPLFFLWTKSSDKVCT